MKQQVLIIVEGGMVVDVMRTNADIEVILLDYDNLRIGNFNDRDVCEPDLSDWAEGWLRHARNGDQ